ncbi:hypothetical protein ACFL4G_01440 [Thermodesulfobacteriota bacterium]
MIVRNRSVAAAKSVPFLFCALLFPVFLGGAESEFSSSARRFDGWRVLPIRSQEEFASGLIGGEAEGHNQGIARSRSNPDIIYVSNDCGQIWRSADAGETWKKTLGKGLYTVAGQSVEVDPVDPRIVFAIMDNAQDYMNQEFEGLYRSTDSGDHWKHILPISPDMKNSERYEHNIAYDPTSIVEGRAIRWYAGFTDIGLYRTEDGGDTWKPLENLPPLGRIYCIHTHPRDGQTVFIGSEKGLFVSDERGTNLYSTGYLPEGAVSSIAIDEKDPDNVYAVLRKKGLYKSSNGGKTFYFMKGHTSEQIVVHPGYSRILYLVGRYDVKASYNRGMSWQTIVLNPGAGLGGERKTELFGPRAAIVPHPQKSYEAVAFSDGSIWKKVDRGILHESVSLFTGYNCGWWNQSAYFDRVHPDRFALFCAGAGMVVTDTGGDYFLRREIPVELFSEPEKQFPWHSIFSGSFQPGTNTVVAAAGRPLQTKLVRSEDTGQNWQIVDHEVMEYLHISFHPLHANIVYAGDKISRDGGRTFEASPYLKEHHAQIIGMSHSHPNTIYATDRKWEAIYRSDDQGRTWRIYTSQEWVFARDRRKPVFTVDPKNPNRIYILDKKGGLVLFEGDYWEGKSVLYDLGDVEPNNFVQTVAVDWKNTAIIYVGMHACGISNVWRSMNGGNDWENISYNLPRVGVSSLYINPSSGELLFGSCFGTWVLPPPYEGPRPIYDKCISMPSCHDRLKNGDEEGIDSGGSCRVR